VYAWLMPASTVMQAVIGGITVLTGLLWWTVAIHLLVSMAMVWLAVQLYVKIGEPDDGVPTSRAPKPLRQLTIVTAVVLAAQLVSGTLVTAAGPHAGDKSIDAPVPRLQVEIVTLVQLHAVVLMVYLALLLVLGFALRRAGAGRRVIRRLVVLLILVAAQALVGRVQYAIGVPAALVAIHVAGAAACTAATSALWASMRERTKPEPVER
jgi:cytochrome c oxidase assembly protein subunit 15